jgi:hypothetical protein
MRVGAHKRRPTPNMATMGDTELDDELRVENCLEMKMAMLNTNRVKTQRNNATRRDAGQFFWDS